MMRSIALLAVLLPVSAAAQERWTPTPPNPLHDFPSWHSWCTNENRDRAVVGWKELSATEGFDRFFTFGPDAEVLVSEEYWTQVSKETQKNSAAVMGVYLNCVLGLPGLDGERTFWDSWDVELYSREVYEKCEEFFMLAALLDDGNGYDIHYPGGGMLFENEPLPPNCR